VLREGDDASAGGVGGRKGARRMDWGRGGVV